jgi:23S rRNA (guanosine2251-2'-O)-methyltransferase
MPAPPVYQATTGATAYAAIDRLPVIVLLEGIRSLYNVGSFFRTADAVRAQQILLAGITAGPDDPRIAKTALGAEQSVPSQRCVDAVSTLNTLRSRGYQLAAVETSLRAVDLFDWHPEFPVCLVFGHEVDGVTESVLECCDVHVRIPTLGMKQSLNVATAGGVVLYDLLRKYRQMLSPSRPR